MKLIVKCSYIYSLSYLYNIFMDIMYDIICDTPVNYETWSLEEQNILNPFLFALCCFESQELTIINKSQRMISLEKP